MANFDDILRLGALAERMTITREGAKVIVRCQGDDGAAALELVTSMRDELLAVRRAQTVADDPPAEDAAVGGDGSDGGEA